MAIDSRLRKSALQALAQHFAGKNPEIALEESEIVPSSKKYVHRFVVRAAEEPNGANLDVVLDDAGAVVELSALAAAEGKEFFLPGAAAVALPARTTARLVTIDPRINDFQLDECGFREKITVTIPPQAIREKVDVYFLADNTGSMGGAIANVKAGAATILSTLAGTGLDIQYGVGNYEDFTDGGPIRGFENQQNITANTAAVLAAINAWVPFNGGDTPESQLYALQQIPTVAGWRPDALKFIVWFGDAPGHEPICPAIWGGGFNITRATVITALHAVTAPNQPNGIAVLAISVNTGSTGLDGAATGGYTGCPSNGLSGQATSITSASGGSLSVGVNPANVAQAILDALIKVVQIKNVKLVPVGAIAPFVTSISPAGGYGPLDPTKTHNLVFEVVFERDGERCGLRDQIFTGEIQVVMDGTVVARKPTKITIPKCRYHYVAKFVCGVVRDTEEGCSPLRPGRYATEINLYNGHCAEASIRKSVIPVVLKGEAIGREPRFGKKLGEDKITLPPQTATMDDCCRLAELLDQPVRLDGPLMVGFLAIESSVPLTVTAVYTATGLCGGGASIDVEQIAEVRK